MYPYDDVPPAGVVPAGTWSPDIVAATTPITGHLADLVDPTTGELLSLSTGAHPIDAEVQFRLRAAKGKAPALLDDGLDLAGISKLLESSPRAIEYAARKALEPMLVRGDIEIQTVRATVAEADLESTDTAAAVVTYTNLQTGAPDLRARVFR